MSVWRCVCVGSTCVGVSVCRWVAMGRCDCGCSVMCVHCPVQV